MKNWFMFLVVTTCVSFPSLAESTAKKDRGGSCTDNCIVGAKKVVPDNELLTDTGMSDEDRRAMYSHVCTKQNDDEAGNVYWCEENCQGEGGTWTKLTNKDRAKKVQEFVKDRKGTCKLMKGMLAAPH